MMFFAVLRLILPAALAGLLCVGCGTGDELPFVSLEPPLPVPGMAKTGQADLVRIGVAPIFSSVPTFEQYAPLVSYLAHELGRDVVLTQRATYHEMNELVRQGRVHCAFICSGAFALNGQGMDLLAVPLKHGEPLYRAICLASSAGELRGLLDLRGAALAVTDPLSFSGRGYVLARMEALGRDPETFFGRQVEVVGHDTLVRQIATGQVDAGCVNSFVLEQVQRDDPQLAGQVRVLEQSDPFGAPPVVVPADLEPAARSALFDALAGASDDPAGREALDTLGVERFVAPPDGLYDDLAAFLLGVAEAP